jgi:hypothetical protein
MMIPQKIGNKGSLKWIQGLSNEHSSISNREIASRLKLKFDRIQWLSPLEQDNYSECRDESFLELPGLGRFNDKLKQFWPQRGPQRDALVRAGEGGPYFLEEAKASIPEITSSIIPTSLGSNGKGLWNCKNRCWV